MPTFAQERSSPRSGIGSGATRPVLMGLIVLLLSSCSSESSDAGTVEGATIDVDGRRFAVEEVRRCEPHRAGEDNTRLLAFGADGLILNVSVSHNPVGEDHELSMQGGGVGLFGGGGSSSRGGWMDQRRNSLSGPPFEQENDRLRGALTVYPPGTAQDVTRDVSFDLPIPASQSDCNSR